MSKTRSRSRAPRRGPRHEGDPDRRVKWTLRYQRRGDTVVPHMTLVRRGRPSRPREVAPEAVAVSRREARRRDRHDTAIQLGELTKQANTVGPSEIAA